MRYIDIVQRSLSEEPFASFLAESQELPQKLLRNANYYADYFFYLKKYGKAKEVCSLFSEFIEGIYDDAADPFEGIKLFEAALYWDLAERTKEAQSSWNRIVQHVGNVPEDHFIKYRNAHLLVYQAYAFLKLGQFMQVEHPAQRGFDGIRSGKGIHPVPYENTLEFSLPKVLKALAVYKLEGQPAQKKAAQKALLAYKEQNVKHGRLGYGVIFDLQFSYPDVFTPVLPGSDPDED